MRDGHFSLVSRFIGLLWRRFSFVVLNCQTIGQLGALEELVLVLRVMASLPYDDVDESFQKQALALLTNASTALRSVAAATLSRGHIESAENFKPVSQSELEASGLSLENESVAARVPSIFHQRTLFLLLHAIYYHFKALRTATYSLRAAAPLQEGAVTESLFLGAFEVAHFVLQFLEDIPRMEKKIFTSIRAKSDELWLPLSLNLRLEILLRQQLKLPQSPGPEYDVASPQGGRQTPRRTPGTRERRLSSGQSPADGKLDSTETPSPTPTCSSVFLSPASPLSSHFSRRGLASNQRDGSPVLQFGRIARSERSDDECLEGVLPEVVNFTTFKSFVVLLAELSGVLASEVFVMFRSLYTSSEIGGILPSVIRVLLEMCRTARMDRVKYTSKSHRSSMNAVFQNLDSLIRRSFGDS
eukprot:Polyplicarium_translucidae@DN3018_c0_g1_i6.p1